MANDLELSQVAETQNNKYVTSNDADLELGNAIAGFTTVSVTTTSPVVIAKETYLAASIIKLVDDGGTPPVADFDVQLEERTTGGLNRGPLFIWNATSFNVTNLTVDSQPSAALSLSVGHVRAFGVLDDRMVELQFGAPADSIGNAELENGKAWSIKLRNAGTSGDFSNVDSADVTEDATPVSGDLLFGWLSTGEARVFDIGNLPTGTSLVDFKDSVRCATTANITLSGEQTIDGVTTSADRVLVKDQSTGSENGIYVSAAGAWARATDFDADAEVTAGVVLAVEEGTANGDKVFILTTNDPITVGSTALTFAATGGSGEVNTSSNSGAGEGLAKTKSGVDLPFKSIVAGTNVSLTSDADTVTINSSAGAGASDWKNAVRAASTTNGTLATAYENGDTLDGVTLATNDRILLKDQTTGSENGIYAVNATGAPTRATDADADAEVNGGMTVFVSEGTANGNKTFQLTTDDPITVDTTALTFAELGGGGASALNDLTDVVIATPAAGDMLLHDGSDWDNKSINDLTADATPDGAADYVMTWDASASDIKKVLIDNLPGGGGGSNPNGCLAYNSTATTGINATSGHVIAFDAEIYDDNAWHDNVTNNSRQTVPTGVTRVDVEASIQIDNSTANTYMFLELLKNGAVLSQRRISGASINSSSSFINLACVGVNCVATDYFEIQMTSESDTSVDVRGGSSFTIRESVDAAVIGQQTIYTPAGAMLARTTNGAASGTVETTTNRVMLQTLNFDAATDEFAQFSIQMPKSWDEGALICQFIWSHPSTATNFDVIWGIQAVAFANDDAADTAFGTAVTVTDTGGTTDDIYITAETAAMTVAGTPGAEEWVVFQVYRDADNGSDNLAVDARLHGVKIHYTTDAATDD